MPQPKPYRPEHEWDDDTCTVCGVVVPDRLPPVGPGPALFDVSESSWPQIESEMDES